MAGDCCCRCSVSLSVFVCICVSRFWGQVFCLSLVYVKQQHHWAVATVQHNWPGIPPLLPPPRRYEAKREAREMVKPLNTSCIAMQFTLDCRRTTTKKTTLKRWRIVMWTTLDFRCKNGEGVEKIQNSSVFRFRSFHFSRDLRRRRICTIRMK